jgi:hypothetical protein
MREVLALVAWTIPTLAICGAAFLVLVESRSSGGFFPGLGYSLALTLICAANGLSVLVSGLYFWLYREPTWLKQVLIAQFVGVFATGVAIAIHS